MTLGAAQGALAQTSTNNKKKKKVVQTTTTRRVAPAAASASQAAGKKTVGQLLNQISTESRGANVQMQKGDTALPEFGYSFKPSQNTHNLEAVKPPRSSEILQSRGGGTKAEYERVLDQQIQELYKLTQRFKNSPNRGELWLRLAELYVEKAGIVDARKQDAYDQQLADFKAGKTKIKPVLNTAEAKDFNRRAIQLYEWFERDFPKDEKMDQALFFLGYNYFEMGDTHKGAEYYQRLNKQFPNSPFVGESHFSLGEYHFENEKWADAYKEYTYVIKDKKHRLNTFALYKGAWCLFRLGKTQQSLSYLEYIIKSAKYEQEASSQSRRAVNKNRLEQEALRDIVIFYAEARPASDATAYFRGLLGDADIVPYLEKLAYYYSDKGGKDDARDVFKMLIGERPDSPKAFDWQYQIVQNYFYAKNSPKFREELYIWIKNFAPNSPWYEANKANKELIDNSFKMRETTLRNYVLQQHQTAQNSHAAGPMKAAYEGYGFYLEEFGASPQGADMHFYFGELLYDMKRYDEAAVQYKWLVDNSPQSKFADKAAANLILALEKSVPSDAELQKRVANTLEPQPLDPKVERFIKASQWYITKFPKSEKAPEIKFRIGRLYYMHNQFDESTKVFREIVQIYPKTKYAEYSANLLLDTYNLRKDYAGLEKAGAELLAVQSIASSKVGADIKNVMEKASFKKGQDLEVEKKYGESAQAFETFAKTNPRSELATTAIFNAGVNYERAGMIPAAIAMYNQVLKSGDPKMESNKPKVRRLLAKLYQDTGNFEEAARLYKQAATENPKDPLAPNFIYNTALLNEALGKNDAAIHSYEEFIKMAKRKSETSDALYSVATMHRKANHLSIAIDKYKDYLSSGAANPEKVIEAHYWISDMMKRKRQISESEAWANKTIAVQRRLGGEKKLGAQWAAKLKFADALKTFAEYKQARISANPAKQKETLDKKIALLGKLNKELADVIKYDAAEEIVSSLSLLGESNLHMYEAIMAVPVPSGLNAEETKQYKAGVEQMSSPFVQKAKESFKLAVDRGWELQVYNDGYHIAMDQYSRLQPGAYYNNGEQASDVRIINWMAQ
ncbi:MAG: tetratricopeptide repeat protein [Bdellovibrionales bacterium]|nr:tetratricopeptide repeat protein [Bdellovibrionales bacterium]